MRTLTKTLIAAAIALVAQSSSAAVLTHGVGGTYSTNFGAYNGYPYSDFDRAEFMFAPEYADTLTISNFGSGLAHQHGGSEQAEVEVYDGSNWITVFTANPGGGTSLGVLFSNPITFTGMTISGLRLDTDRYVDQFYHSVNYNMTYTTSGTPPTNNVPEPATIALLGLGLLGFVASRRKSAKSKTA